MSVRMRHTKGHTGNRRSHHSLSEPRLSKCADCGLEHQMHRVCENCGKYRGRVVIDVEKINIKKEEKAKKKQREIEQTGLKSGSSSKGTDQTEQNPKEIGKTEEEKSETLPLNPEQLSKK
jgi:large subunit ribosomal protein L32